jgi:hypothetical protein
MVLLLLASCAAKAPPPVATPAPPTPATTKAETSGPAWLFRIPNACTMGESGPTLVPTDALAEARRKARALLATRHADRAHRSATAVVDATDQTKVREIVLETSEGTAHNAEIVTMWYDAGGSGPGRAPGCAYAVACPAHDVPPDTATWISQWREQRGGPQWLYALSGQPNRLCVVGICGPTLKESDAPTNAEDVGRLELAEAISMRAETTSAVLDDDETLYAAVTRPCETCQEQAKAGRVTERWFDSKGEGPLPYPGTAYALMCLDL